MKNRKTVAAATLLARTARRGIFQMAVKRTTKSAGSPAATARARVRKPAAEKATATKKAVAKRTVSRKAPSRKTDSGKALSRTTVAAAKATKTTSTEAPATTRPVSKKTAGNAVGPKATTTRKATLARTQRLVDETPLRVDDGDEVAKTKIAVLRAAKTRASDHSGRARRSAVERASDPPPAAGAALIERVSRAIERELTQIEVIVGGHYVPPRQRTEAERRARTLASLARTLREVTALRLNGKKEKREDDDAVPRDLSELRLALARRLDQLVADAKTAHPDATE